VNRYHAIAIGSALLLCALPLFGTPARAADPRVADLVQAGKIRLAVFLPQYNKDPATGEIRGVGTGFVAAELMRALAARIGIEMQILGYPNPSAAVQGLKARECDVVFMGIEPSRAAEIDFTPAVVQFDYTFLAPRTRTGPEFASRSCATTPRL
jgi:polar amino acid transport system substrate-binding protein